MNSKICCDTMYNIIENCKVIEFVDYTREYDLVTSDKTVKALNFCPFCGQKLDKRLNTEYYDILYNEYGIEYPEANEADKVPEEFKSDKWWRKRDL